MAEFTMDISLLDKVKNAVSAGILKPDDYESAITASRDNVQVAEYLRGLQPSQEAAVVPEFATPAATFAARQEGTREQKQQDTIDARTTDKGRSLTLEEIYASPFLRENGIMPGDVVKDGAIKRVYSTDEDAKLGGEIITQEAIDSSPYLQENNVSVGSRFIGGTLIDSEFSDAWTQFRYMFDSELSPIQSGTAIMERYFPFKATAALTGGRPHYMAGQDWNVELQTPDQFMEAEGYMEMSPDQRREAANAKREREIYKEFGQFFEPDPDSLAGATGQVVKSFADPTLALSMGTTLPRMAFRGASTIGGLDVLNQVGTEGEVDPARAAKAAAAGLVFVPAVGYVVQKVAARSATKGANKLVDQAQKQLDVHITREGPVSDIAMVLEEAGINPLAVEKALVNTSRKLRLHGSSQSANTAIEKAITKDSAVTRQYSKAFDQYLGSIATRLRLIDEGAFGRLRETEFKMSVNTYKATQTIEPFLKQLVELPAAVKSDLTKHIYNGDFINATALMNRVNPLMTKEFEDVIQPLLKQLGEELQESGSTFERIANYFPRGSVKDYDGLRQDLGLEFQGYIDKQLAAAAKRKGKNLNVSEKEQVIESAMRGYNHTGAGKASYAKERVLTLKNSNLKYYRQPEESLSMYVRNAINDIEVANFFKGNLTKSDDGLIDIDDSITNYVKQAMADGNIDPKHQLEMTELISSRFKGGQQSASNAAQNIKDLGYLGTIANPVSAVTQLADPANAVFLYGFRHTISAMFGGKALKMADLGLDQVAIELTNGDPRALAVGLNKMMSLSLFKATDRLGKETLINAAFKSARSQVKTDKGVAAFKAKHGKIYGDEIDSLVADLKTGDLTDNVKLFAFNNLADVQPITLSEMPEEYLNAKNGRLLYMLKSFTLKQWDIVRREVVGEYNKGNKLYAAKQAARMAGYLTVANTGTGVIKDLMRGREIKPEDVPDRALWALLGVFGMNKYTTEKYFAKGDIVGGILNTLAPATPLITAAFTLGAEAVSDDPDIKKTLRPIPLVGDLTYNWFAGGAEEYNERMDKERRGR